MSLHRVLIVEDNRELARVLRAAILSLGEEKFEVVEVPSGEEALLELGRGGYDLAIVDIVLPGMDGVCFAKKFRKLFPDASIILISGADEERLKAGAKEVGAQVWFTKPLEFADLLDTIERQLGMVDSILGDSEEEPDAEEQASYRMSDLVADLRDKMGAKVIAVVDEVGRITLQAGSAEEYIVVQRVLPLVMAAHAAALKASWGLDSRVPRNFIAFETDGISVYLASLDYRYALVAICARPCPQNGVTNWHTLLADAVTNLREILKGIGLIPLKGEEQDETVVETEVVPEEPEAEVEPEEEVPLEDEETDPSLLELLNSGIALEQADEFWEKEADKEELLSTVNPKAISYEQAGRLGLVKADEEESGEGELSR